MKKVLVVEDEQDINEMIIHHLEGAGFKVKSVLNGEAAIDALDKEVYDIAILDILLPGVDGWYLCSKIRSSKKNGSIPIIFLSALSSESDKVRGFDLGGDDYLNKPFSPREMVSRVKAILRRTENGERERTVVRVGKLYIDFLRHRIEIDNRPVHLTGSEFQLLRLLASNEGRVFSREELLSMMRQSDFELELGNVDVHVHHLRQKIEEAQLYPDGLGSRLQIPG
jgi:DNA-binding response OmpR family regulator